jgi:hypothetical protein
LMLGISAFSKYRGPVFQRINAFDSKVTASTKKLARQHWH